jgi:uncharacterized protein
VLTLSAADARAIALRAQGFGARRARPGRRTLLRHIERLHCIQIDAVNVLVRSHYLPLYARAGAYDRRQLDQLIETDRALFEYRVKNVICYFPVAMQPSLRWCMAVAAGSDRWLKLHAGIEARRPGYMEAVLDEVRQRGPLAYTELSDPGRTPRDERQSKYAESSLLWFSWADGDSVLNGLARMGRLTVAHRKGFEPRFDLTERVIPPAVLACPTPAVEDAQRDLVRRAAQALGVGTVKDVAGYFRLPVAVTRKCLRELIETGEIEAVAVEGWDDAAYLSTERTPGTLEDVQALLSPFDSLLWERSRTRRLFGFEHVFELYVPADRRRYGYYVLPFLSGDRLAARVDLKADRKRRTLLVAGAFVEPGVRKGEVAAALAAELRLLAGWLGLERIEIGTRGDLVTALRRATRARAAVRR